MRRSSNRTDGNLSPAQAPPQNRPLMEQLERLKEINTAAADNTSKSRSKRRAEAARPHDQPFVDCLVALMKLNLGASHLT